MRSTRREKVCHTNLLGVSGCGGLGHECVPVFQLLPRSNPCGHDDVREIPAVARNVEDLRRIVRELNERGVSVEFIKNRLTFSGGADPTARLMLTMLGAFARFERELIRERQREGIAIAKAQGRYKGRKRALNVEQIHELREMAAQGLPKADLARAYNISRETVYQYLRAAA